MANHKSAEKRNRQTKKRNFTNSWKKSRMRTALKKLRQAIADSDKETALELLPKTQGLIDKLAKTSALKKGAAARKNSRLASQVAKL